MAKSIAIGASLVEAMRMIPGSVVAGGAADVLLGPKLSLLVKGITSGAAALFVFEGSDVDPLSVSVSLVVEVVVVPGPVPIPEVKVPSTLSVTDAMLPSSEPSCVR